MLGMKKHKHSQYARPFRQDSIWNQPVPAGVSTTAITNSTGTMWLDPFVGTLGTPAKLSISCPVYFAKPTDTLVPVWWDFNNYSHTNGGGFPRWTLTGPQETTIKGEWFNNIGYSSQATPGMLHYASTTQNSAGTLWTAPAAFRPLADAASPPRQIRVPGGFGYPASGTDGYLAIVQPDGTVFECIQAIWLSTGELTCYDYSIFDASDFGDGYTNGTTTTMIPIIAGQISQRDMDRDTIDHALAITWPAAKLNSSIVYPAYAMDKDGGVTGGGHYVGSDPVGARLIIPAATNIAGHTWTSDIGLIIATALQTYGAFIVNRAGGANISVQGNIATGKWTTWSQVRQDDLTFILNNWLVRVTTAYTKPSGR